MRFCLIIIILSLFHFSSIAQGENWKVKDVLTRIEKTTTFKFSYEENNIEEITVSLDSIQFEDTGALISYLGATLQLNFEYVNDQYIIIRPYDNGDLVDICGTLTDEQGRSVSGALVTGDLPGFNAVTDNDGSFHLKNVPYDLSFTIRHLTFNTRRTKALELLDPDCKQLTLFESVGFLETLTVKDYLTIGITKERNQIKIYPAEIMILPGHTEPDLLQSIQLAPGVNSPYETASGIHVRGGSPDQNLVLWNGIRTYNQGHFFGMLSAFNPYITDEVTFIKSGTNAKYGERVSSVIDIRTSDKIPDQSEGGFGFNLLHTDAFVHQPIIKDKLSLLISGRRSLTDLINTVTYDRYSDRVFQNTKIAENVSNQQTQNRFFFHDFSSTINYQFNNNYSLKFSSLYDHNSLNFITQNDSANTQFSDELYTKNEGYNLSFSRDVESGFNYTIDGFYTKYLLSYAFNSIENDTLDIAQKKNLVNDYGLNVNTNFGIGEKQQLSAGYEYTRKEIRYAFENQTPAYNLVLDVADNRLQNHALYGEYILNYGSNSHLQLGSRLNYYYELQRLFLEPRFYLEQHVGKDLALTASAEYRSQGVSQIRESIVSDLSLENKVWTLASPDGFPITTSYQVSTGGFFERQGFYAEAEAYFKQISGITTLTFGFLNPLGNEYLTGNSQIKGFDLFIKKQFTGYKSWLSYAYIYAQNEFAGLNNNEPFPGNWNIEHTVKWSHFFTFDQLQLSLGWLWHTGKSYTEVVEQSGEQGPVVVAYEGINTQNLPVYHRLDASLVYELKPANNRFKYRFGISVLNVYDRRNQLNREFRTTPSLENSLIETNVFGLGITPNVVFRVFW